MYKPHKVSTKEIAELHKKAIYKQNYLFLGFNVQLSSNDASVISFFNHLYINFRNSTHENISKLVKMNYIVLLNLSGAIQNLIFWEKNTLWEILDQDPLSVSENIIFDSILTRIPSYIIFHGVSLCFEGKGVGICGVSGSGKSTLSIELACRNFHLLSDEVIAMHKQTNDFHPFPRLIACDKNTQRLVDNNFDRIHWEKIEENIAKPYVINPLSINNFTIEKTCQGEIIIFLETPSSENVSHSNLKLELMLLNSEQKVVSELNNFPGICIEAVTVKNNSDENLFSEANKYTLINVSIEQYQRKTFLNYCNSLGTKLIYRVHRSYNPPDPNQRPFLLPISKKEGMKRLLTYSRNSTTDVYFGKISSREKIMDKLSISLLLTNKFDFYTLAPGMLSKTADLIEQFLKERFTHEE